MVGLAGDGTAAAPGGCGGRAGRVLRWRIPRVHQTGGQARSRVLTVVFFWGGGERRGRAWANVPCGCACVCVVAMRMEAATRGADRLTLLPVTPPGEGDTTPPLSRRVCFFSFGIAVAPRPCPRGRPVHAAAGTSKKAHDPVQRHRPYHPARIYPRLPSRPPTPPLPPGSHPRPCRVSVRVPPTNRSALQRECPSTSPLFLTR